MFAQIETSSSTTFFVDGKTYNVAKTDPNWARASSLAEKKEYKKLVELLDVEKVNKAAISTVERVLDVEIRDNVVYKKDGNATIPISNEITNRILELKKSGRSYVYMTNFLKKVLANPSQKSVEELYLFLMDTGIPITEDGDFLAYRKVDNNYMSFHPNPDGTYNRNQVGDVVTEDRDVVNPDREQTCSRGLHFCAFSYLSQYHGGEGRVMIVKINPADVVSIPSDYNNAKGRCCKYEVVSEHIGHEDAPAFDKKLFISSFWDAAKENPVPEESDEELSEELDWDSYDSDDGLLDFYEETEIDTSESYASVTDTDLLAISKVVSYIVNKNTKTGSVPLKKVQSALKRNPVTISLLKKWFEQKRTYTNESGQSVSLWLNSKDKTMLSYFLVK